MEDIKKVPILRFPEFSGEWESKRLKDQDLKVIDGDRGKNYPNGNDFSSNGYCLFLNAKNVTKFGFVFDDVSFITKQKDEVLRKGKLVRNDLIITTRGTVGNISFFNEKVEYENIRINSGMVIIRNNNKNLSSKYLYKYFYSPEFTKTIKKIAFGSAQPQLTVAEINKFTIASPSFDEQQKIADFLTIIDNKIEQLSKKKQLLESYKKGSMQNIFSQELRFKDEGGNSYPDWEKKKLGEIAEIKRGLASQHLNYVNNKNKGIRLLRINDFLNNDSVYIEETENTKKLQVKTNDLLIAGTGATAGIIFIVPEKFNNLPFSYNVPRIRLKNSSNEFIYFYLKSDIIIKQQKRLFVGNAQPFLDTSVIRSFKINLPSIQEQTKIANFLTEIDKKINFVEKQLNGSKEYKKSLLQQMFI